MLTFVRVRVVFDNFAICYPIFKRFLSLESLPFRLQLLFLGLWRKSWQKRWKLTISLVRVIFTFCHSILSCFLFILATFHTETDLVLGKHLDREQLFATAAAMSFFCRVSYSGPTLFWKPLIKIFWFQNAGPCTLGTLQNAFSTFECENFKGQRWP